MYATTSTGYLGTTSANTSARMLGQLIVWSSLVGSVYQKQQTSVEEWNGLSYAVASSMLAQASDNLGTVRLQGDSGVPGIQGPYVRLTGAYGTKVDVAINQEGNTNLYHVQKTTNSYTVWKEGDGTLYYEG